ncbi:hypothetical protein N7510_011211 [Penicillium lagena]|uniref:uncharacterized protein n=1 Tax=Penicillium lagena TaxID=94218 RepID=UPI0025420084|nr:uncharacterized protein N7510_011211 [Penicillium lagena]KAJ5601677.1 hypothetical protein N7510_011211 [Penicillium lagena]
MSMPTLPYMLVAWEAAGSETMSIRDQITALQTASKPCVVFGEKDGDEGKGFSLVRTLLAHKTEIDPWSPLYFELNIQQLSGIKTDEDNINYRLALAAFNRSTMAITAGIDLIQGPPGTGKTRTAVAILIAMMALKIPSQTSNDWATVTVRQEET